MMALLPTGLLGLVFAALIAAIVASLASKINSIATIFTLDFYAKLGEARTSRPAEAGAGRPHRRRIRGGGRRICSARPLLGSFDQAFQYIQEYTGFFTPGIVVIFVLGLFWKRANEAGALAGAIGSFVLSLVLKLAWPELPFIDRVGLVFLLALALSVIVSLLSKPSFERDHAHSHAHGVSFATSATFNMAALGVVATLTALVRDLLVGVPARAPGAGYCFGAGPVDRRTLSA